MPTPGGSLPQSIRSQTFKRRFTLEGEDVRRRFDGSDRLRQPGIEELVRSDPEVWGMPIESFFKYLGRRQSFLPPAGERLLEFLGKFLETKVDTRVAVDANIPGTLILTIYVYEKSKAVIWQTIGSVSTER